MKATLESLENSQATVDIEVDEERVAEALARAYHRLRQRVQVPGFRKGKVPRPVLERHIGKEALLHEALDELVNEAYRYAVDATNIDPVDTPDVDIVEAGYDKPLKIKAKVDVKPEAALGTYKGLAVTKYKRRVENDDVEAVLNRLREQQATLEATDRTEVQQGDFVTIDFEGFIEGKPFQGGAATDHQLEVGKGDLGEDFDSQLVGAVVGEARTVRIQFPDSHSNEQIAGKEVEFNVTVREIKLKRLPDLDDAFAASVGEFDTLLALRSQIREDLESERENEAVRRLREEVVSRVADGAQVEIPDAMIEREIDSVLEDFLRELAMRGVDPSAYVERVDGGPQALRERVRSQAERRVRAELALDAVAKREGMTVTEEEVQARITQLVEGMQDPESTRRRLERADQKKRLKEGLLASKAIDFLVEQADVTTEEVDELSEAQGEVATADASGS